MVQVIDDLVTENAELQQQLTRKEAELTRAEETVRREQQQVSQLVQIPVHVRGLPWDYQEVDVLVCTVVKTSPFSLYRRLVSYSNSCNPVRERKRYTDNS